MTHNWTQLDNLLLGRTLHLHSVTPLSTRRFEDEEVLTADSFSTLSRHLLSFLRSRLSEFSADVTSGPGGPSSRPSGASWIRQVRASKIALPSGTVFSSVSPSPWAIEVEVQGTASNGLSKQANRAQAHFIFLSTNARCSSTHYPILLWKAPPEKIFKQENGLEQAPQEPSNQDPSPSQPPTTARLLISHIHEFIERYFDCRISQQKPMCSMRGKTLEDLSNTMMSSLRQVADKYGLSAQPLDVGEYPLDLGYAVPAFLGAQDAQQSTELIDGEYSTSEIVQGPAPYLNLITLSVPSTIVSKHLQESTSGTSLLPAVQGYLAAHTSLVAKNLTLVRVGVANVFIGSPTTTSLISGGQRGQTTNGEVRLKFNALQKDRSSDRRQHSAFESARIADILGELVKIADRDEW